MGKKKIIKKSDKHMVVCVKCGKRFDANWGASYNSQSGRYTCPSCVRKMKKARKEAENTQNKTLDLAVAEGNVSKEEALVTKSKPQKAKKIWGIILGALGVLELIMGFARISAGDCAGYFVAAVVCLGIGVFLLLSAKKNAEKYNAALASIQQSREDKEAEYKKQLENTPKTCPSCGATTKGSFCEYCGSKLE